jgi:archaellum component FlaC
MLYAEPESPLVVLSEELEHLKKQIIPLLEKLMQETQEQIETIERQIEQARQKQNPSKS